MCEQSEGVRRPYRSRRLLALAGVLVFGTGPFLAATVASANVTVTYAQGVYGNANPFVFVRTTGQAQRIEQWTYHLQGTYFCSEYGDASTIQANHQWGLTCSYNNPVHNTNGGYGYAWMETGPDTSDVLWTANVVNS